MAEDYRPDSVVRMPAVGDFHRDHLHDQQRRRYVPPPQPRLHHTLADVASILGLAEGAVTEPVRAAITSLMDEIAHTRWDAEQQRHRQDWLEHLAHTHSTLPLLNRRGVVHALNDLLLRSSETGLPGSVLVIEARGVEALRRRFGLEAGDAAQRHVAGAMRAVVGETDLAAHIDGDFFAVVMIMANVGAAVERADAIAGLLNQPPFRWRDSAVELTVHFGVSDFAAGGDGEQALAAADADRLRRSAL